MEHRLCALLLPQASYQWQLQECQRTGGCGRAHTAGRAPSDWSERHVMPPGIVSGTAQPALYASAQEHAAARASAGAERSPASSFAASLS
eukprot:25027-Chlamydomonas_euryale.AAC.2